ncbi:hypothetical protein SM12BL3_31500 [Serratia marcescens]|nr:hypothetical protein SM12BL3_31500 [Serratia marcescens]
MDRISNVEHGCVFIGSGLFWLLTAAVIYWLLS